MTNNVAHIRRGAPIAQRASGFVWEMLAWIRAGPSGRHRVATPSRRARRTHQRAVGRCGGDYACKRQSAARTVAHEPATGVVSSPCGAGRFDNDFQDGSHVSNFGGDHLDETARVTDTSADQAVRVASRPIPRGVAIDCGVWPFSQGHWNWQRCLTSVCGTFERRSSRRDGVTIAQRFIAGKQEPAQNHSPIGTAETCRRFRSSLRDLVLRVSPVPALKCRAILKCPYGTASRLGSGKSVPQSMVTPERFSIRGRL